MSDIGCVTLTPEVLRVLCQDWPIDRLCNPTVPPAAATVWPISPGLQGLTDWNNALSSIPNGTGNHVLELQPGVHNQRYRIVGSNLGGTGTDPNGAPGFHNWVTSAPGAVIDSNGTLGGSGIEIESANHWNVVNNTFIGSTHHAIRIVLSENTAASPGYIHGNTINGFGDTGGVGINIRGSFSNNQPGGGSGGSSHWFVTCNEVGGASTDPGALREFQEGIYIGRNFSDTTHDIFIARNDLYDVGAELLELKPGSHNVTIVENDFHDSELSAGTNTTSIPTGHVTLQWANTPHSGPGASPNTAFARNRLWNLTQRNGPVRAPITVGIGGQLIESNLGWGNEFGELVNIQTGSSAGEYGPGTFTVRCNTNIGADVIFVQPLFPLTLVAQSNVPDDQTYSFVGPTTGTADAGEGPGSGLAPVAGSPQTGIGCNDATNCTGNSWAGALFEDQR